MIPITSMEPMNTPIMSDRNPDKVNTPAVIVPCACQHDQGNSQTGSRTDSQYGRVGQRIIECGLQHQSRCCECHSAKEGGNGLRQADCQTMKLQLAFSTSLPVRICHTHIGRDVYRAEQQIGSCQCKDEEEQSDTVFCSFVIH